MSKAKYLSLALGLGYSVQEAMLEEISTVLLIAEARAEARNGWQKGEGHARANHID